MAFLPLANHTPSRICKLLPRSALAMAVRGAARPFKLDGRLIYGLASAAAGAPPWQRLAVAVWLQCLLAVPALGLAGACCFSRAVILSIMLFSIVSTVSSYSTVGFSGSRSAPSSSASLPGQLAAALTAACSVLVGCASGVDAAVRALWNLQMQVFHRAGDSPVGSGVPGFGFWLRGVCFSGALGGAGAVGCGWAGLFGGVPGRAVSWGCPG